MVNLIASTQVSELQKRQEICGNKVVIYIDWQSSYCGRHTGMPYFMLSAHSAEKNTVKKLGEYMLSLFDFTVLEMGSEMILLREHGKDGAAEWGLAVGLAQDTAAHLCPPCGVRQSHRKSLSPPLTGCLPLATAPFPPARPWAGVQGNGTPPPCSSAEYGQDGNKIKRKKELFFSIMHLSNSTYTKI